MRKKLLVLIAVVATMLAALAGVASAGSASGPSEKAGPVYFKTKVTPGTGVRSGQTLTAKSTGAIKSTEYYCIISAISVKGGKALTASNTSNFKVVKSNKKGAITCKLPYRPFSAKDEKGKTRHCPPTKADKKAGFKCAIALADKATIGAKAASVGYFTPAS